MKISRLETHDRLQHLKQDQSNVVQQGAEDCLKRNQLSLRLQDKSPYVYLFAHVRTHDNGSDKRLIWQPRLGKPEAQSNSYLFRAKSHTDLIEVCWLIPDSRTWGQHKKGNITESEIVVWSINQYQHNKLELERPDPEDIPEERIREILKDIAAEIDQEVRMESMYKILKPETWGASPSSSLLF